VVASTHPVTRRATRVPVVKRAQIRWWEMRDAKGKLMWVAVCKRGAVVVVRRLAA
jgi:hypothetical protein